MDSKTNKTNTLILVWGFGPVGTAICELLLKTKHKLKNFRLVVFEPKKSRLSVLQHFQNEFPNLFEFQNVFVDYRDGNYMLQQMTPIFEKYKASKIFIVDATSGTNTMDILKHVSIWSQTRMNLHYINTSFEVDETVSLNFEKQTMESLIESITVGQHRIALKQIHPKTTFVVESGMNPGLISHFAKMGVLRLRSMMLKGIKQRMTFPEMAQKLGVLSLLCTEIDTQVPKLKKQRGEFVNTWSVEGFISEGDEVVQIGNPINKLEPSDCTIKLFKGSQSPGLELEFQNIKIFKKSGFKTQVHSRVPTGKIYGYVIPHGEGDTLSHFFTLRSKNIPVYRPLVHYVYQPCESAIESISEHLQGVKQKNRILFGPDIQSGKDEVGVYIETGHHGSWWYGTRLNLTQTKQMGFTESGPTAVQVAASLYSTILWILEPRNHNKGILFPEALDSDFILKNASPYLGDILFQQLDLCGGCNGCEGRG